MAATAKLMAFLGMNPSGFNSGVDQAGKKVRSFEGVLSGMKGKLAAAFSITAITAAVKSSVSLAGAIVDSAENLRITTDQFQALVAKAQAYGLSLEDVTIALNKVMKAQEDFVSASPSKATAEAFGVLGFTRPEDADALNAAEIFEKISEAAQRGSSEATAAFDIMGKSGVRFRAFMGALGQSGLKGLEADARNAGRLVSEAALVAADETGDAVEGQWDRLKKAGAKGIGSIANWLKGKGGSGDGMAGGALPDRTAEANAAARVRADEEAAKKIIEETAEIRQKMAYDAMTDAEKRLEIERQIAELDAKRMSANTATAWAQRDKERAELEARLAGLPAGMTPNAAPVDSLRQIGVVGGTAGPSPADLQRKLLVEAQKQGKYSAEMVRLLREKKGGVF